MAGLEYTAYNVPRTGLLVFSALVWFLLWFRPCRRGADNQFWNTCGTVQVIARLDCWKYLFRIPAALQLVHSWVLNGSFFSTYRCILQIFTSCLTLGICSGFIVFRWSSVLSASSSSSLMVSAPVSCGIVRLAVQIVVSSRSSSISGSVLEFCASFPQISVVLSVALIARISVGYLSYF